MAIKKSELYSSLWQSCDDLRGGMDASQYKDYVLVLLFIKYISDKYAGVPYAPIRIPEGSSFQDMVALKGTPNIGDDINKKIIAPLVAENDQLSQTDFQERLVVLTDKPCYDLRMVRFGSRPSITTTTTTHTALKYWFIALSPVNIGLELKGLIVQLECGGLDSLRLLNRPWPAVRLQHRCHIGTRRSSADRLGIHT